MSTMVRAGTQLPFDFHRDQSAVFDSFCAGDNGEALGALRHLSTLESPQTLYLWGPPGTGKSHLLQAMCHGAGASSGKPVSYLPLREAMQHGPEICDGLESCAMVCVDDLEAIAGNEAWEAAIFALYNRLRDARRTLAASGAAPPRASPIALADLRSRLEWGLVYQLRPLSEGGKRNLLLERGRQRGLTLDPGVVDYILRRHPRDVGHLCAFMERLDRASLSAHRQVTIPFVKSLLDE
ncbi:MAG: DnaA regulatory inactivator Hda [Gammaproteobacteria bacterium]|nr:DnaA regulatory inactivator Hda [Gammaproteobacteria bacterium]